MTEKQVLLAETSLHLFRLYFRMRRQRSGMKKRLRRMLAELSPDTTFTLPDTTFQRMFKYAEIARYAVCGALVRMQGRRMTAGEQTRELLLSIIAPLYDDLFDDQTADLPVIRELTRYPHSHEPRNITEAILREAYIRLLDDSPDPDRIVAQFCDVCHWREASRQQANPLIPEAELYRITYHKSYHSVLLFYTAFDRYPSPAETAMAFPMAGLMQLTNDAFNTWKDIRAGIYTLPILYRRYGRMERRFLAESARFNQALVRLPYPVRRKKEFAQTAHALHAMGLLAVRNLRQVAKGTTTVTELALLGRTKLVCDMDNLPKIWTWVLKVRELTNLATFEGPTETALKRDPRRSTLG